MSRTTMTPHGSSFASSHRGITTVIALAAFVALAGAVLWMYAADESTAMTVTAAAAVAAPAAPQAPAPTPVAAPVQTAQAAQTAPAPAPAAAQEAGSLPAGTAGQQAFIDPKTGKLRPMEHDDVIAAAPQAAKRTLKTAAPQELAGPEGSVGVVVPEDLQTYTVATRQADGSVTIGHVSGPKAATTQVRSAKKAVNPSAQDKEERNDR